MIKVSKKFVSTLAVMLAAILLRIFDKLDNLYFTICLLTAYVLYVMVEGTIDAKALKIKTSFLEIGKEEDDGGET